jgi:transcriptional regulator with XRE-family HTH domain
MTQTNPGGAPFAQCFGENLIRHREAADLSQELLGDLAALHRTAVGQLERGERVARCDTLVKLAAALRVDPSALLEGIIWTPPRLDAGSFNFRPTPQKDG